MKRIPLTQGQFAIVDDKDYEYLNQWNWHVQWNKSMQSFYATRKSKLKDGKQHHISMAREILGLKRGDKRQADHKYHNTLDNRRLNLRIVTHQQNQWNNRNSKGYTWRKDAGKYRAEIKVNSKSIHLGYFPIAEEAHNAYLEAKKLYHKF